MTARNPSRSNWLEGGGWIPLRKELMESPAWRKRPKALWKILERLEIEHMRHAGKENGELFVSYGQFVDFGVSRKDIRGMLALGEALGLLEVIRPENWAGDVRPPNGYRLTYFPAKGKKAPTDEWSFIDAKSVDAQLEAAKATLAWKAVDDDEQGKEAAA